jgi:hypothetical protein
MIAKKVVARPRRKHFVTGFITVEKGIGFLVVTLL